MYYVLKGIMEVLPYVIGWGTPLGIGLFLFLLASGAGIFFWGVSHLHSTSKKRN